MAGMLAAARREEDGFTLAEVLVALTLFAVLGTTVAALLLDAVRTSGASEARVLAANLATRQMEAAWGLPADAVVDATQDYTLDGRTFTVRQAATFDTVRTGTGSACDGASGPAAFKRVSVVVTWPDMHGVEPVRSDSVRSLPITGSTSTTGVLTVPGRDRDGRPLAGQVVTVTNGASSATATTRADGCAVFPSVAPGTSYVASVAAPGYVGVSGSQLASSDGPISVTARTVSKAPAIRYDRPATLRLTLSAPAGYSIPASGVVVASADPSGVPFAVAACGATPCTSVLGPQTLSVEGLFPSSTGYTAWFTECGVRPTSTTSTAVAPAATADLPITGAGGVDAVVAAGATPTPASVHAVSPACPERVLDVPLSGGVARMALPVGTWRLVADPTEWGTAGRYAEVTVTAAGQTQTAAVPR